MIVLKAFYSLDAQLNILREYSLSRWQLSLTLGNIDISHGDKKKKGQRNCGKKQERDGKRKKTRNRNE